MMRSHVTHVYPIQRVGVLHDRPLDIIQRWLHLGPFKREKVPDIRLIGFIPERKRSWWRA